MYCAGIPQEKGPRIALQGYAFILAPVPKLFIGELVVVSNFLLLFF